MTPLSFAWTILVFAAASAALAWARPWTTMAGGRGVDAFIIFLWYA